ncbi:MAG: sensor histidine kinase [Rectinemataceae bacterium]
MHFCVCDYALDIAQNACEAGSGSVRIEFVETDTETRVVVQDDGSGMEEATVKKALDPFRSGGAKHPARKVGLGLPFLVQAVEAAHGGWKLESAPGKGTTVSFSFPKADLDCPPTGDVAGFFLTALCLPGGYDMEIVRTRPCPSAENGTETYRLVKSELADALGSLERASSLALLKEFLVSQEYG